MESKKEVMVLLVLMLVLALFSTPSDSARDIYTDHTGLALRGTEVGRRSDGGGGGAWCCDDCQCMGTSCVCWDSTQYECTPECQTCQCDHSTWPFYCYCGDVMGYCPPPCFYGGAGENKLLRQPAASSPEAPPPTSGGDDFIPLNAF